jgi:hypothetical protein
LFHTTPNLEPTFWRTGSVSSRDYENTSSPLQCHRCQENSLNIGLGHFPPKTTFPIMLEDIPLCVCKI